MKPSVAITNQSEETRIRNQRLFLKYLSIVILLLLINHRTANAWDLELGVHQLMPKLWTGAQKYESGTGGQLKFKPVIQKTISGRSASIGFIYESFSFQLEQSAYHYDSDIPQAYAALTTDTTVKIEMKEQRVGVSYHLERELAGIFAGIGMTREEERFTIGGDTWIYEADVPFGKIGVDLVLGAWRVRIEQIHLIIGRHSSKVNSLGILLYL